MFARAVRITSAALFLLTSLAAYAQSGWSLLDAGIGILDESQTPPRILERDRTDWSSEDIVSRLGDRRYFEFWIVGPRPETFRNRFGIPVYDYRWRSSRMGEAWRGARHGFNSEGWGGYQLDYQPGSYQVEVYLINRDTEQEHLIKSFQYRVVTGPAGRESRPHRGGEVYLSDLAETASGDIHGGLGKDKPYWQADILIGSQRFGKGLVTHPGNGPQRAYVEYALDGRYSRFLATLGSSAHGSSPGSDSMNYFVWVDGRLVEQARFPTPPAIRDLDISVRGARSLRLEVDNGGNGNHSDHAAWGNARLRH